MTKYLQLDADHDERVGRVAEALANGRRRATITRLCRGPASTTELADHVGASLPTMHQHLDTLRAAGLVTSTKRGRTVTHVVDLEPLGLIDEWVASRRSFWTAQLDSLAAALEPEARP